VKAISYIIAIHLAGIAACFSSLSSKKSADVGTASDIMSWSTVWFI